MHNRLSAALVAMMVIVASGTAPTLDASRASGGPDDSTVVWSVQPVTVHALRVQSVVDDAMAQQALDVAEAGRVAEAARAEEARTAEAAHVAEEAHRAEQARLADEARVADEVRAAEVARVAAVTSQVQQALLTAGYSGVGAVDGIAGAQTTRAVRAFQADAGYAVTGEASTVTLSQLAEKAEAGWRRPAPVQAAGNPGAASTKTATATSRPAAAAPAQAPAAAWTTYVANSGGQSVVDQCAGGLTAYTASDGGAFFSVPYLAIHNTCGGAPILRLSVGETVVITSGGSAGTYQVVDSRDVVQGATTDAVADVAGDILLQTCYFNSTTMRVVGAVKVS